MAVSWSRPLDRTCYEVGHCWDPTCPQAFITVTLDSFRSALRIYAIFYLVTGILRRKTRTRAAFLRNYVTDIVRSSAFLAMNAGAYCGMICVSRRLFGNFTLLGLGILPGICASAIAIAIERKARRGPLSLYMFTVALETFYKMLVSRNSVQGLRYGEVLLFSLAMAVYTYLYKRGSLPESSKTVLRYFIGQYEVTSQKAAIRPSTLDTGHVESSWQRCSKYVPQQLKRILSVLRQTPKHATCQHPFGCLSNCTETPLVLFTVGYCCQAVLRLRRAVPRMLRNPGGVLAALRHPDSLYLGLFLASLTTTIRMTHCVLRWVRDKDSPAHGLVSGFLAGWAMLWYRSSSLALWVASKLLETVYFRGVAAGKLPHARHADIVLYAISCGFVIHAATLEPHNIRPGYWSFLLQLTNNRFGQMNRKLMDVFETKASTLYPDYWPNYDRRYTSL